MSGYMLLSLLVVGVVVLLEGPDPVVGGCAERDLCCEGKDNKCRARGPRMNGKSSQTCFCDETCLILGDCCTDFKQTCRARDCIAGDFEDFEDCSSACGPGHKIRRRPILQKAVYGGKKCANIEERIYCWGNKCKVPRHSSGHMEVRETGKIIPAEYGSWRSKFDPFTDIRKNLFNHYNAKDKIKRPAYCAKFEVTEAKGSCAASRNPWGQSLAPGNTICIECQPFAMQRKLGVRCKGHGVFMRESRWNAVTMPGCHGKWVMKTKHEECTCSSNSVTSFIFI